MPSDKADDQIRFTSYSQIDIGRKKDEKKVLSHEEPKSATEVNAFKDNVN